MTIFSLPTPIPAAFRRSAIRVFSLFVTLLMLPPVGAQGAKYAGDAFSLGVGARSLALGGATIAGPFDYSAGYWNPAGLGLITSRGAMAMHAETFGGALNHDFLSYSAPVNRPHTPIRGYGGYFYYLGGGGIKITALDPISGRPFVERIESHGDYALAGNIAGQWRSVYLGASARIMYRDLGVATGWGGALDVGGLWRWRPDTYLAITITDLSTGVFRYSTGVTESVIPALKLGVRHERSWREWTGRALASGDIRFEGRKLAAQFYQKNISLDTHFGAELSYHEILFGRIGSDIGAMTLGAGVAIRAITVDFAYLRHDYLDNTYRISAGVSF